jgi:hypothetical protein
MNRHHRALTALATLALLPVFAPSAARAATECLGTPIMGGYESGPAVEVLTTTTLQAPMYIAFPGDAYPPDYCSGVTATVQKTDGTHRMVVPFDERGGVGHPPALFIIARIPVPLGDGAGDWVVTRVAHGTDSRAVDVRLRVVRGTVTTIDTPGAVASPAKSTITGLVRRYTSTGALAPAPTGTAVRIMHSNGTSLIATAKTDSTGRYRVLVPFTVNTSMRAVTRDFTGHAGSSSGLVTAHVRAALVRLLNSPTAVLNDWWRLAGQAHPGGMWTSLEYLSGSTWVSTGSLGYSKADGTFTRWWKPAIAGTFKVRITITKANVDGSPIVREKTVTVVSKQTQPTYLSAVSGPTYDLVVHDGTQMSTYGHLKVRHTNGTLGPFANEWVYVQARQLTNPIGAWYNYAAVKTTSTGYFYMNWNAFGTADLEVRVVYTSPYITIKGATLSLGIVDVN